jgi:hypothetical protein
MLLARRVCMLLCLALILAALTMPGSVGAQDNRPTEPPAERPGVILLITPTPDRQPPSLEIRSIDPAKSAGMIPVELEEAVNRNWWWLLDRQLEYYNLSGNFCQMFWSHEILPAVEKGEYPNGWYKHPTDQDWSWDDLAAIRYEPLPFAIKVDVYDGPNGAGFVACYRTIINGVPWERCRNYGAESSRAHPWEEVKE